jgi:hypothetical protein
MLKVIYCCECKENVNAEKVSGDIVYPHRKDLKSLVFYKCNTCSNFVGTHKQGGKPLGVIATAEIKKERMKIHSILDPLWREKLIGRKELYKMMSEKMGFQYHTASLSSIDECAKALSASISISNEIYGD